VKRSEINRIISESKEILKSHQFFLPEWAFWKPADWKGKYSTCSEIIENQMGWDITDFGRNNYDSCGLFLFTIRNGNPARDTKKFCEKIMIAGVDQETPMHFHWQKTEDIINRGGGNLVIELYNATSEERFGETEVTVRIDGILRTVNAGGSVILQPGQSICLKPYLYHRFYGANDAVLIGEVSSVNDDAGDNRFYENVGRFPDIEEDEAPLHLLVSDYQKYI
jgi:D-lyxose ketol-isomerase